MQFVVNNLPINIESIATDMTLLGYLRGEQNLTGTKEGCASGDCGACTVLVGTDGPNGIIYKAVNSCIVPLGSLQNQYVMTVEGLGGNSLTSELHPVQESMVNCHGSQCGFCTPGFVMSLVGLHSSNQNDATINNTNARYQVIDAISGNLCRCTGYRPIVEAGIESLKKPAHLINIVQEWRPIAPLLGNPTLQKADQFYWRPTSEEELRTIIINHPDARFIAGGTDLMLEVTQLYKALPKLIDLNAISTLNKIQIDDEKITIGAAATYSDIEKALAEISPEFVKLLSRLGSRQIRNRGTIGGNICNASPIADSPPFLLALNAELIIGNSNGEYRNELLTDFYLDYKRTMLAAGEYLAQIVIQRSALLNPVNLFKISKRYEDDISAVMGAFRIDNDGKFYIAYGGMAAIPKRANLTENYLNQHSSLDDDIIEKSCEILATEFSPLADVRASAEYRMAMASSLLRKACLAFANNELADDGVFAHA